MNSLGLSVLFRMGCVCARETVDVNGRSYRVRARLAEGGFSRVDLVEDVRTREMFALKRISCHSKADERQALQEAEYHTALSHPYILECVDSALHGTSDGTLNKASEVLLLLPYLSRGTLQADLEKREARREHYSEEDVLTMFKKICEAIQVMHEATPLPLSHRDLKPANVLLTFDNCPIIMDLGSMGKARCEVKGTTEAHTLQDFAAEHCSMPYRAPELFNVESYSSIDERTDIWSLGCLLYALCFFRSPFDAAYERGDSVALAVISGNINIPETSPYSTGLHEFIQSLIVVNAMERPFIQSVLQTTDTLLRAASHAV